MKDKFCVSKTLTYLVLLVAAVVGTFYATNYANSQKLTSESQAAGKQCMQNGVKGVRISVAKNTSCVAYATKLGTLFHPYTDGDTTNSKNEVTSICCIPDRQPKANLGGKTCKQLQGSGWFADLDATALDTRLTANAGSSVEDIKVTAITTDPATGKELNDKLMYPGKSCYRVQYTYKVDNSCRGMGGSWYVGTSCDTVTKNWNAADAVFLPVSSTTDTVSGRICCKQAIPTATPTP